MDTERIKAILVRTENIICCDCESEKRIPCIKYPECASIRELRECILELEKPKQYYPLGMEPKSKNCTTCGAQYTCDLPMDCQGRQYVPKKNPEFFLAQERCLSCELQCPTDCPLDKAEI